MVRNARITSRGSRCKKPSFISWRIHNIDNLKNQIELTEVGEGYGSGKEIKNPKRAIYKGHTEVDSLFMEFSNGRTKGKFIFKMKFEKEGESTLLRGFVQKNDGNKDILPFHLVKISDDTSAEIGPVKSVEVILNPPPPPPKN